jgi:hypothetical protein
MKYAIIIDVRNRKYLTGFTNIRIEKETMLTGGTKYTVELREMTGIFLTLEGDAKEYFSN